MTADEAFRQDVLRKLLESASARTDQGDSTATINSVLAGPDTERTARMGDIWQERNGNIQNASVAMIDQVAAAYAAKRAQDAALLAGSGGGGGGRGGGGGGRGKGGGSAPATILSPVTAPLSPLPTGLAAPTAPAPTYSPTVTKYDLYQSPAQIAASNVGTFFNRQPRTTAPPTATTYKRPTKAY